MRIAIVVPVAYVEGESWDELAHRYIPMHHARHLAALGHEVHLFADGPPRVFAHDGFTVHVLHAPFPAVGGVVRSPHLIRAADAIHPDVIHLHHLLAAENVAAAVRTGRRVFAEYHGGEAPRWRWRRALARWASARLAGAFFANPTIAERLRRDGALAPDTPVHISPETTSRYLKLEPHEAGGLRVLVVGRCEAPKDPDATLATFRAILARAPDAQLVWASASGADTDRIRAAMSPAVNASLTFGPVPVSKMPATFASADVTICTSAREIGGTVLSESLSQGTPFAAFHLPTFEALAPRCEAVALLPSRDPEALAERALALAAADVREEARRHFEDVLSWAAIARARTAIYAR
ncbi:MAG: glycosyltransferase [Deltaproteobacteria bacterium]